MLTDSTVANSDADHTFMMFSATFPKEAREAGKKLAALDHVFIKVGRTGSTTMNITQRVRVDPRCSSNQTLTHP